MNPTVRRVYRWMIAGAAMFALVAAGLYLLRRPIVQAAVASVLRQAGAEEVRLTVAEVTPSRLELKDVGLRYEKRPVSAGSVTIQRPSWWSGSLGAVRVRQARLDLEDVAAVALANRNSAGAPASPSLPLEEFAVEGTLGVKLPDVPGGEVRFAFEARANDRHEWEGSLTAKATGLDFMAEGTWRPATADLVFRVPQAQLELATWQAALQPFLPIPSDTRIELAGTLRAVLEGRLARDGLTAEATVNWSEGRLAVPSRKLVVSGLAFEAGFEDLVKMKSKPGTLRAEHVAVGDFGLDALEATVAFQGPALAEVSASSFKALGGTVTVEPFVQRLDRPELAAVVNATGLDVEQIVALTKDLPARASGRVDGRLPVRIDENGLKLGTGWLALTPGVRAELEFNAKGLLTSGRDAKSPAYAVLEKVESGLLRLKLGEMRLDIYPPDQPPGRSATLHLTGEPVDPTVKAPVTLDLNVNGPLEKLLSLGLDSRVGRGNGK